MSQSALSEAISALERKLGVPLLERHRPGARVSREGRDLLPLMTELLAGVAQLKAAARDHARTIRVGTVNAGASSLLVPAVREFGAGHPSTTVDVATLLQAEIQERLIEGRLDVGLINAFPGDELPAALESTVLLRGVPKVCCRADDPLAAQPAVSVADLRKRSFVAMRPGYLMNRLAQRLFGDAPPPETFSTDGAEMGKTLVATGTGRLAGPVEHRFDEVAGSVPGTRGSDIRHDTTGRFVPYWYRDGDSIKSTALTSYTEEGDGD